MFEFPYEGSVSRIDVDAVAGTILRRRRRIPGILDMGHLPPQDIRVADIGLGLKVVFNFLMLILLLILTLIPMIYVTFRLETSWVADGQSLEAPSLSTVGGRCGLAGRCPLGG